MKEFAKYYKSLPLNKRINLKGIGAMLNPWLTQYECPYEIKDLQSLSIDFARIVSDQAIYSGRIFFTIHWDNPVRKAFDILNNTCRNHFKRSHSMYPANSFEYLNIGSCNH